MAESSERSLLIPIFATLTSGSKTGLLSSDASPSFVSSKYFLFSTFFSGVELSFSSFITSLESSFLSSFSVSISSWTFLSFSTSCLVFINSSYKAVSNDDCISPRPYFSSTESDGFVSTLISSNLQPLSLIVFMTLCLTVSGKSCNIWSSLLLASLTTGFTSSFDSSPSFGEMRLMNPCGSSGFIFSFLMFSAFFITLLLCAD